MNKWLQGKRWEISLGVIIVFAFGVFLLDLHRYGASFDEPSLYSYADRSIAAYRSVLSGSSAEPFDDIYSLSYYGPAYLILGRLGAGAVQTIAPRLDTFDAWHVINFINFLMGVWLIYLLAQRIASKPAAWLSALLYLTQPLLWGHGVMNPKDMPFMTAFLGVLVSGMKMVDMYLERQETGAGFQLGKNSRRRWEPWAWLLLTGILSGLTVSIRILGPAALGLIWLYALINKTSARWKILFGAGTLTILTAYLSWPFLWRNPISNVIQVLQTMTAYPWIGTVRFEGHNLLAGELPFYYLPKLLGIQFTLPLILLSILGTGILLQRTGLKSKLSSPAVILLLWFWLPILAVMLLRPNSYDNFRQYLFITPPLFAIAAVAVDKLFDWLRSPAFRYSLAGLLLLPGIIAGIWLHPYEYVYYNGLVGWTGNVGRSYETDYWATAMCEAGETVSQLPVQTNRVILGDLVQQNHFTRCATHPFETLIDPYGDLDLSFDYVVLWSRFDHDLNRYPDLPARFEIKRGKTVFVVVKSGSGIIRPANGENN